MVTLTDIAAEKLREMLDENATDETGLRIYVKPGGCTGFSYGMALDSVKDADKTYQVNGVEVIVDEDSLQLVQGSEIDYVEDFESQGFRILNPNATSTCGCGSSFRTATAAGQPGSCD
ncbi:iron-sulfur cluster assembly accessory protein [Alicyclobacillus sp. SO9]|uniref:HesB/IscA family protein n=1 Tax=Alicyclobacillus sp. SO9 TaxID=2665646 RepID=UPI0018E8EF9D|nr:iron-sulfur cluster assembly accessory protein [Alicyclobacillus sp. SO9]QQE80376.1 iron-sulfur cluster assembly accessory protein [Alicyclobacillus sp. SO9]